MQLSMVDEVVIVVHVHMADGAPVSLGDFTVVEKAMFVQGILVRALQITDEAFETLQWLKIT